jgi:hypothetical protein
LNQNTTGSAATLTTARTIGGVSFNGSANINLPGVNTAGNQNTSGTAAVSTAATVTTSATASAFKVPFANTTASTTGNYGLLQDSTATFTYNPSTNTLVVGTVSGALSGNATTATTLQTARTIGGVSFNGSANINLPGVNTAGNQNTTGSAATLTTARTINGVSFNGSANITITAAATNVNTQLASLGVGTAASGTAGQIRATGDIVAHFSDDRLKTKLGNIEDALAKVRTLSGFYYVPNETAQDLGYQPDRDVGVSAQQVQAVQPEATAPAPIDEKYLTVRYERLVPLLIEAIKELDSELQSIKQQLKD